jgi:hypothetical protein
MPISRSGAWNCSSPWAGPKPSAANSSVHVFNVVPTFMVGHHLM